MKIKNIGRAKIVFAGGSISPNQTLIFEDDKLASKLLYMYPDILFNVDTYKEEVKTIPASNVEDNNESLTELRAYAKELGIKGGHLMKEDTLKAKIAEVQG